MLYKRVRHYWCGSYPRYESFWLYVIISPLPNNSTNVEENEETVITFDGFHDTEARRMAFHDAYAPLFSETFDSQAWNGVILSILSHGKASARTGKEET
jgi:hypothetical protein